MPPLIDEEICTRCGACVDVCQSDVFSMRTENTVPMRLCGRMLALRRLCHGMSGRGHHLEDSASYDGLLQVESEEVRCEKNYRKFAPAGPAGCNAGHRLTRPRVLKRKAPSRCAI